ncbi:MAG: hypothetical protein DRH70_02900 [Candidatus Coatesbacteria bacterium]|nr:MAG: hypothetical protein DRH70_02900 [Candidatus Coatesbacteria bacterium]
MSWTNLAFQVGKLDRKRQLLTRARDGEEGFGFSQKSKEEQKAAIESEVEQVMENGTIVHGGESARRGLGGTVVSRARLSRLSEVASYRRFYENRDVRIPLYENMTAAQLALRLPISVGIPRQIVDDSADALFGDGRFIGVRMVGADEAESVRLQAFWDRVFSDNGLRQRLLTDAIDSGICGGTFYSVSYDPAGPSVLRVQSISYDQLWDIEYDELDREKVLAFIFQWEQAEPEARGGDRFRWHRVEMDRERIVRLRAVRPHTAGDDGEGVEFEITSISEHNLGMIPIVHIPNSVQRMQTVGDSDIAPLIPMLDAVNQMMSDAYWQCYNDQSILKAINIDPPDSDDLEESAVRLGGDQIHFLTENDQLRQDIVRMKPVGIPESFFKTLSLLVGQIYRTAGESHLEPLKWTGTNISGIALRLLYEPLAKKTYRKRIYWASGFKQLAKALVALANSKSVVLSESGRFTLGGPEYRLKDVETMWGPLIPGDEVEQQNIVLADLSAGLIGPEDARKRRGYE